mmetsp:Transcript_21381/g.55590  ORF Transcript_21381/g.55590 Transcript_21381/m.55590 type:complete len:269 (-) Transcript_21381:508-1314(-)
MKELSNDSFILWFGFRFSNALTIGFQEGECWGYNRFISLNTVVEDFVHTKEKPQGAEGEGRVGKADGGSLLIQLSVRAPSMSQKAKDQAELIRQLESKILYLEEELTLAKEGKTGCENFETERKSESKKVPKAEETLATAGKESTMVTAMEDTSTIKPGGKPRSPLSACPVWLLPAQESREEHRSAQKHAFSPLQYTDSDVERRLREAILDYVQSSDAVESRSKDFTPDEVVEEPCAERGHHSEVLLSEQESPVGRFTKEAASGNETE